VNVFLSYAVSPLDVPIAAVLRAVTARYDVSILLPERNQVTINGIAADTQSKIKQSDAVIALVTSSAPRSSIDVVNRELQAVALSGKPVIALVESGVQIQATPDTQIVYFNSFDLTAHEKQLESALAHLQQQKEWKDGLTALGWIAGITLGLIALSELVGDKK
jgi:hypothetical protein